MFAKLLNAFKKKNTNAPATKTSHQSTSKPAASAASATTSSEAKPAAPKGPSARELAMQQFTALTQNQPLNQINDAELLAQLVKLSPQLDKKTNREVRERLNLIKEQQKQAQAQHAQQVRLCERLETLSRLNHHPLFDSEFNHVREQWQQLPEHDAELAERVSQAMLRCVEIQRQAELEAKAAEQTAMAASQAEAEQTATAAALATQENTVSATSGKSTDPSTEQTASDEQANSDKTKSKRRQLSEEERRAHEQAQQQLLATAQTQLAQLEAAIEQADAKKARDVQDRLRATVKQLDRKHAQQVDGKLHLLSGQLRDLIDWQAFAALPKLEAMCAEMEKLAETELPPAAKADAVRELQNQWRAAKPPQVKQAQALWDRFKAASDRAWAPCAEHFDAEKAKREFNLSQREVICDSLEQFAAQFNADTADWKALSQLLEQAHQEFRRFFPVPRAAEKTIQQRYDEAIKPLKEALRAEHLKNEQAKQRLIEQAKALSEFADAPDLVDRVKRLQEAWKQVGPTRRHEDQKLWLQFKANTDGLFEKRRSSRELQREQTDARANDANLLIQAMQQLAASDDETLSQSAERADELESQFTAFADLPETLFGALQKKFKQASDNYRERVRGIPARREQQQTEALWARACNPQAAEPLLPEALERQQQARATAIAAGERAQGEQADERGLIAIELEVLADLDSPLDARAARQQWQMSQLTQGAIGHADPQARAARAQALFARFCSELPLADAAETELQARVGKALQVLKILS